MAAKGYGKPKESISIYIYLNAPTNSYPTTSMCSVGLESIKCSVEKFGNIFGFTLTNKDKNNS